MIPLFSAKAANQGVPIENALRRVVDSHWYVLGSEVTAFEREFAKHVGSAECVSLANGTDALELALRACGVASGELVACVANAGFYSSTAIHAIGAVPRYVDIDPVTLNMSPSALEQVLVAGGIKVVIATHLYGQLADMEALTRVARRAGAKIIEDCAQAHGAQRGGRRAGSFGDIGCFSFYPTKNLGALGDGGAVTTNVPEMAAAVRTLRQYGWSSKYHVELAHGRNSRLDEIQAAVLREKLPRLDQSNDARRRIAARYNAAFAGLALRLPASVAEDYVAHLYVVGVDSRDRFREHLKARDVGSDVHYPVPDHRQKAYAHMHASIELPHTDAACACVISLPCFPGLSDVEVEKVIAAVRSYFDL